MADDWQLIVTRVRALVTALNDAGVDVVYADSSPAKAKTIGDEIVRQMRARHLEEFQARTQLEVLKDTKNNAYQEMRRARLEGVPA